MTYATDGEGVDGLGDVVHFVLRIVHLDEADEDGGGGGHCLGTQTQLSSKPLNCSCHKYEPKLPGQELRTVSIPYRVIRHKLQ